MTLSSPNEVKVNWGQINWGQKWPNMTLTKHGHQKLAKNDRKFNICIINPFDLIWLAGIIKLSDFCTRKCRFLENSDFSKIPIPRKLRFLENSNSSEILKNKGCVSKKWTRKSRKMISWYPSFDQTDDKGGFKLEGSKLEHELY